MIYLVGMGPGDACYTTPRALDTIAGADLVYGFPKHLDALGIGTDRGRNIQGRLTELAEEFGSLDQDLDIALLVSGDPTVFSLSRRILGQFDPSRIRIIPGLGSYQILCSHLHLQTPLPDRTSVHGRDLRNLIPSLLREKPVVIYTDRENNPRAVAALMTERGLGHWRFVIGSQLGTEKEEYLETTAAEAAESVPERFMDLNLCYTAPVKRPVMQGKLFGIGIGPGDPELLTLKALRVLEQSDLILCPRGRIKKDSLARTIIEQAAGIDLPVREVEYPMTDDPELHQEVWEKIASDCIADLDEGKTVSFVTLGDTGIYSAFTYFLDALRKVKPDLNWEIIPGISSIQLGAARLGEPLVIGRESCAVLPLPGNMEELTGLLEKHDTLVLMKSHSRLKELKVYLERTGLSDSAALIQRVGLPGEEVISGFTGVDPEKSGALSLVIIRKNSTKTKTGRTV